MKLVAFLLLAFLAIGVHFLGFELRYAWYLSPKEVKFLRYGYVICIFCIFLLWLFYPSRVLVAALGLIAFVFPIILGPVILGDEHIFVPLDWKYSGFVILSLLMLICATELRRRI